mmetsp:Transcript_86330/g.243763  ORF Transcript_86330/g.243763 Transcript_86330/m.243763 type:complete len:217 (+) Transcript_86330:899-1549(+)
MCESLAGADEIRVASLRSAWCVEMEGASGLSLSTARQRSLSPPDRSRMLACAIDITASVSFFVCTSHASSSLWCMRGRRLPSILASAKSGRISHTVNASKYFTMSTSSIQNTPSSAASTSSSASSAGVHSSEPSPHAPIHSFWPCGLRSLTSRLFTPCFERTSATQITAYAWLMTRPMASPLRSGAELAHMMKPFSYSSHSFVHSAPGSANSVEPS